MRTEINVLSRELRGNTAATHELSTQIEKAQMEPLDRWRTFRNGLLIAVAGASVGGIFVLIGVLVSAH